MGLRPGDRRAARDRGLSCVRQGAAVRRQGLRADGHVRERRHPASLSRSDRGRQRRRGHGVEADGEAAKVTFTVDDEGQPIHTDAEVEIRPRLFLEGNFFLDLSPGSPSAPELASGDDIPITQTATAVQLDEVLTALQAPQRRGLQRLLEGYGTALTYEPTASDDVDQDLSVRGETAAESLNDAFRYGGDAGRGTTIVNTALLGENPHDLSGFIRGFGQTFGKLAARETELRDLITNFNVFTGALAAESANLSRTVEELAPTLEEARPSLAALSDALPAVRTLAIESQPAIEELPATIAAGDPWLRQARKLVGDRELGGLARLLRDAAPGSRRRPTRRSTSSGSRRCSRSAPLACWCRPAMWWSTTASAPDSRTTTNSSMPWSTSTASFRALTATVVRPIPVRRRPDLVQGVVPGACGQRDQLLEPDRGPDGLQPVVPGARPPFRPDVRARRTRSPTSTDRRAPSARPTSPRSHETRDPRTPARLHRDHCVVRRGPARHRLHPLPAAAAVPVLDPVPRRRPLRAQGGAVERSGGHPGPGPDGQHRRRSRRAISPRSSSSTAGPS